MESIRTRPAGWLLVAGEWLMVSPAIVFLAAAALRAAQPAQYEPARTAGIVFEWISGMPGWIEARQCPPLFNSTDQFRESAVGKQSDQD